MTPCQATDWPQSTNNTKDARLQGSAADLARVILAHLKTWYQLNCPPSLPVTRADASVGNEIETLKSIQPSLSASLRRDHIGHVMGNGDKTDGDYVRRERRKGMLPAWGIIRRHWLIA